MSWLTSTIGLATSSLRVGDAYLLGDTLIGFKGERELEVDARFAELIRLTVGDNFLGDYDLIFILGEAFLVGEMTRFAGEMIRFTDTELAYDFRLGGEPNRLLGLRDVLFFFLAGDFLRGTVAVLIAVKCDY